MGAIADTFNSAFRDYVVPGDPGSGVWNPDKSTIRSIGSLIEGIAIPVGPDGALFIDGGTTLGLGLYRDDAQIAIRAPAAGTPGQRHALILVEQPHGDDEIAIVGSHIINGIKRQTMTMFSALSNHDDAVGTFRPYTGFHAESYRGDYNPLLIYYDGAIEMGGLLTGATVWNLGYTQPDWVHNFTQTHLQGATVVGNHAESVQSGNIMEVAGNAFFGAVDGTTLTSTLGILLAWSASGGGTSLLQSVSYIPATNPFQPLTINAAETRFGQGHVVPDADNTRDLGKSGGAWRNVFTVNAVTVTSDGRLKRVRGDGEPTEAERAWAAAIRFVPYQMLEAIAEKGEDKARLHWGVIAQDVVAAGEAAGITDPFAYGFLTRDPRFETIQVDETVQKPVMVEKIQSEPRLQEVNGRQRLVMVDVPTQVQKTKRMRAHGPDGKPLSRLETDAEVGPASTAIIDPTTKRAARRAKRMVPHMIDVPQFETVTEKVDKVVPVMLENGEQDALLGVRYEALFAFLRACGV